MIGLIPFLISYFIGYYVLRSFKDKSCPMDLRDIFVIAGLGLGVSAQIVFYALLIRGCVDPVFIIAVHLLCLCLVFFFYCRGSSRELPLFSLEFKPFLLILLILSLVLLISIVLARLRPWGDWDGWAYWNFQSNFLFRSGYGWDRVFIYSTQAYHPWTLPLMVVWGWIFYGRETTIVPMAMGIIFTVSTVGLLIAALNKYVSLFWAALGGVFLTSIPIYVLLGTSQYADIEAAYFILLSMILGLDLLKNPSVKLAALTGLCLGLSAGIKDNNIVASILMMTLIIIHLIKKEKYSVIRPMIYGFIGPGIAVVLMKSFYIYCTRNHSYDAFWPGLLDGQKWVLIGQFLLKDLANLNLGGIGVLAVVILALKRAKWMKDEICLPVQFIVLFIIFYIFIFCLSSNNLEWLLNVSFDRMLFLVMPTLVFSLFYLIGKSE